MPLLTFLLKRNANPYVFKDFKFHPRALFRILFFHEKCNYLQTLLNSGITFPHPTAPGSNLRPHLLFYGPLPKLLFHGPPTSKITFSRPLVITVVCHVFFYSFKQNSTYRLFKNSFQQNILSYTNQLQCESIGCFFI